MTESAIDNAVPMKPKRRWWFYAGVGLAALLLLAGTAVVLGALYWNSLIKTYTETRPRPLSKLDHSPAAWEQLQKKWAEFRDAVENATAPPPWQVSADDLNVFLANIPEAKLKDLFRIRIAQDQLQAEFSLPLDKSGNRKLKGRYLNGLAKFNLTLTDGLLFLTVASVQANGKPIPKWLLFKLRQRNLLQDLGQNMELAQLVQNIESIQVKDGLITIKPAEVK